MPPSAVEISVPSKDPKKKEEKPEGTNGAIKDLKKDDKDKEGEELVSKSVLANHPLF
jgi:hypothetical protein